QPDDAGRRGWPTSGRGKAGPRPGSATPGRRAREGGEEITMLFRPARTPEPDDAVAVRHITLVTGRRAHAGGDLAVPTAPADHRVRPFLRALGVHSGLSFCWIRSVQVLRARLTLLRAPRILGPVLSPSGIFPLGLGREIFVGPLEIRVRL